METNNVLRGFGTRSLIQNLVTRVFPPFPPHIEYGDYLIDSLTRSYHNETILANYSKAHLQRFDHRLLDKEDVKKINAINSKRANYINCSRPYFVPHTKASHSTPTRLESRLHVTQGMLHEL